MSLRPLFALSLVLGFVGAVAGDDAKELARRYASEKDSWKRRAVVEGADPADRGGRRFLLEILEKEPWYQREGAIRALERLEDEAAWSALLKERRAPVLEGVARALPKARGPQAMAPLEELLKHKDWRVRRAVVIALREVLRPESIQLLIATWDGEKEYRVSIHCHESLRTLTGETELYTLHQWGAWWEAKRDSFRFGQGKKQEETGRIRTQSRGTNLELRSRGKGLPLLVLPEYGYKKTYLETYLRDLEESNQILYLTLPGADDFKEPKLQPAPGLPDPYYPIDRLVGSLEELHAELVRKQLIEDEPFAILAHGMTAWIAMRYAALHPKRVRRMILVAPYSGGEAWGAGRDRVEALGRKSGDQEMEHFAQSQLYEGYQAKDEDDETALSRKEFTLYFADPRDLEIGRLFGPLETITEGDTEYVVRAISRPLGTVVIPEFELKQQKPVKVPTLVVHGDHSVRTSLEDAKYVASRFAGKVLRFKKSARMPFYEEHEGFVKAARKFLSK